MNDKEFFLFLFVVWLFYVMFERLIGMYKVFFDFFKGKKWDEIDSVLRYFFCLVSDFN